jgi:soluble lytic murein transglycosylase-like protein
VRSRAESFALFCGIPVPHDARRRLLSRFPYADEIERAAGANELDSFLVAAMVEAESSFEPLAESPKGAVGLMQIMPGTALAMGVPNPEHPGDNIEAGTRYLSQLLRQYDGDITLALAAYNAGPSQVDRFGDVPPFPETRRYVEKVLRRYVGHRRSAWEADAEARTGSEGEPTAR